MGALTVPVLGLYGGLDKSIIMMAQQRLEANTIDFRPTGLHLIHALDEAIQNIQAGKLRGSAALKGLLYPAMELKAQGAIWDEMPAIPDFRTYVR